MNNPLISCLCPTRNHPSIVSRAIECFNNQTYLNRELILVADVDSPYIEFLKQFTSETIKLFYAPKDSILGAIRNISVDNASGEYIAQWDDDNIHHKDRLAQQYYNIKKHNKEACFLKRVLIHDVLNNVKGISRHGRGIESTIVALKKSLPRYDNNTRVAEDLPAKVFFMEHNKSVTLDEPQLYIYNIHNNNTCKLHHLRDMIDVII